MTHTQKKQAESFSNMHIQGEMLVLPNVWDAGSVYVFQKQGFDAVATTSEGIAYAQGYADGEIISLEDLMLCVKQITRPIDIRCRWILNGDKEKRQERSKKMRESFWRQAQSILTSKTVWQTVHYQIRIVSLIRSVTILTTTR